MKRETFLESFGHIADAPGGVATIRGMILDLAMHGRLSYQDPADKPAEALLVMMAGERARLVDAKVIREPKELDPVAATEATEVPPGWSWTRFGNLFSRVGAGSTPAGGEKAYVESGVMFLRSQNVHNDGLVLEGVAHIPFSVHERMSGTWVRGGDILLNITGASIGRSAIVPTDGWTSANVNQHVSVLRPLVPETTQYLHALILSPYFQGLIAGSSPGASREGLAIKRMVLFPVPLPPVAEQQRIVQRVYQLMGLCDRLEQEQAARTDARSALTASTLNRVAETESVDDLRAAVRGFANQIGLHLAPGEGDLAALNRVRQTILELAVRGRLTHQDPADEPATVLIDRIAFERARLIRAKAIRLSGPPAKLDPDVPYFGAPPGWVWCTLGELLVSNEAGWSPVCPAEPRSSPDQWGVLKLSAVSWGQFLPREHKVLAAGLAPRPAIEVRDGDFLMSRANTAALVGRSVVVADPPPRLMMSDLVVRLGFVDRVTAEYVNVLNRTRAVRVLYAEVSKGTSDTMRKLSREQILATPVPLPPMDEQARIVRRVAELAAICDNLESQFTAARALRGVVAASVVAHAVSGPATPDNVADRALVTAAGTLTR